VSFVRPRSLAPCSWVASASVRQVSEVNEASARQPPSRVVVVVVVVVVCAAASVLTTAPRTSPGITRRTLIVHLLRLLRPLPSNGSARPEIPCRRAFLGCRNGTLCPSFQGLHAGIRAPPASFGRMFRRYRWPRMNLGSLG